MARASGKGLRRLVVGLAVAAVVGGLIWHFSRPQPVAVVLASVERGTVEATVANTRAGTVKACRRAGLSPLMGGQVSELRVTEGQRVKKGDLLLTLWNDDLKAQLTLNEAEAAAARSRAEQQCLVAEQAQREAARLAALNAKGIATEEDFDRASTTSKAQGAACQAARGEAEVMKSRLAVTRADLERTRLIAPFDGVVAEVNAELHEFVTPSPVGVPTPPAVDLIDNSCLFVSAPIDEVDAARVAAGLSARVLLDAYPNQALAGTVRRVAPYVLDVEKQARTVEVEVEFNSPSGGKESGATPAKAASSAEIVVESVPPSLLPGLSADVEIITGTSPDTLRVPTAAVLDGDRVLVFDAAAGVLTERSFTPGLSNWNFTEVRDGLAEGEQVVTSLEREGVVAGALAVPESPGGGRP